MSRSHENVSCDSCLRNNFSGKRYKCLVCPDYDLCEGCRDNSDSRHLPSHPMQCLLTPLDLALHLGDESGPALTCPVCGKLGHTELTLQAHLVATHPDQINKELMCPACTLLPIREANMMTDDLANHLLVEHSHREVDVRQRDPFGELLSTISRRGRPYRRTSAYSLLRPFSSSSSTLSLCQQAPTPDLKEQTKPLLLSSSSCVLLSQPELEQKDEISASRSIFTKHLLHSALYLPAMSETLE